MKTKFLAALALICCCSNSFAGPYLDAMTRCFSESTTGKDRVDLARWFFIAMAQHPGITELSSISQEKRDAINRTAGNVYNKLLINSCNKELRDVVQHEGEKSVRMGFEYIGRLAMQELLANPNVTGSFSEAEKHFDQKRINAIIHPN